MSGTLSRIGWALLLALSSMVAAGTRSCVSKAHGAAFVCPGLVSLSGARLGYSRALLARDPDGHIMQLASE